MEESYIWSKIQDYYGETKYNGTPEMIQRDKTIFGQPFKRWYIAPAAMVFQAICGSVYAWSVFNRPIDIAVYGADMMFAMRYADNGVRRGLGWKKKESTVKVAPITFYINIGCLGVAASLLGPWLERNGPRKAGTIGGTMFCIGHWIAALGIYIK
ncbi:hypothetical protein BGZ80_007051, partial [Entomortierella chlamydospora]